MAEFLMKYKLKEQGINNVEISSAGTSDCESGSDMHRGSKQKLIDNGISFGKHCARQVTPGDYQNFDYIIYMDKANLHSLNRIFGKDKNEKLYNLMSFAGKDTDVADPWYTGDFEKTYLDINTALDGFIGFLKKPERV